MSIIKTAVHHLNADRPRKPGQLAVSGGRGAVAKERGWLIIK